MIKPNHFFHKVSTIPGAAVGLLALTGAGGALADGLVTAAGLAVGLAVVGLAEGPAGGRAVADGFLIPGRAEIT